MTSESDRPQSSALWVDVVPADQRVRPGDQVVFAFGVENRGGLAQSQTVAIEGIPPAWLTLDYDTRSIAFPRERRNGTVRVAIPVDADSRTYRFFVIARADAQESSATASLHVDAVEARPLAPGLTLTPSTLELTAGQPEQLLRVEVRNVGSRDTEYQGTVEGLPASWVRIAPSVRVSPGASVVSELWIGPPRSAEAGSRRFRVRFQAAGFAEVFEDAAGELRVLAPPEEPRAGAASARPPGTLERASSAGGPSSTPIAVSRGEETEQPTVLAPDAQLAPGSHFRFGGERVSEQAIITVQNRSRVRERYLIEVLGLPDGWYTLTAGDVNLEPGAAQQIPLRLSPRPGPEHPAGEYQFRIRIAPHGYPQAATELDALLLMEGIDAFEVRVEPAQASGRSVPFQMTLRNTGTRPALLEVEGTDPEGRCKFTIPVIPEIEAGGERTVPITVGARRNRFIGSPETFDFRVRAFPAGVPAATGKSYPARLVHTPFLSRRVPVVVGFYLALIALLFLVIAWSPPHVEGFMHWGGCKIHNGPECGAVAAVAATPTPTATTPPTSTPTATSTTGASAAAVCTNDPTHSSSLAALQVGATAYADDRSNIRSSPEVTADNSNRVGQVRLQDAPAIDQLAARKMVILDGPTCGADLIWWRIRSDYYGVEGWVVERDGTGDLNLSPTP